MRKVEEYTDKNNLKGKLLGTVEGAVGGGGCNSMELS